MFKLVPLKNVSTHNVILDQFEDIFSIFLKTFFYAKKAK